MLEQEIAALSRFIKPVVRTQYFKELPEGIATPSAYFPVPEFRGNKHSLNSYRNSFALYMKIFGRDSMESYGAASEILNKAQAAGSLIPLYDQNGKLNGNNFFIRTIEAKKIDAGVFQISLEWDSFGRYEWEKSEKALELYFCGLAASREEEDEYGC